MLPAVVCGQDVVEVGEEAAVAVRPIRLGPAEKLMGTVVRLVRRQAGPDVLDLFPEVHDVKRDVCLKNDADLVFHEIVPGWCVNGGRFGADGGGSSRR